MYICTIIYQIASNFYYRFWLDQLCNQTIQLDYTKLSSLFLKLSTESAEITQSGGLFQIFTTQ